MTDEHTATPRIEFGLHSLKIAAFFGVVMGVFTVAEVAFQLNVKPMLIVGWLAFAGLTTIGVTNYLDGSHE